MTSQKKIEANRLNAQHSTGAKTLNGKDHASGNAITHGFFSGRVLPGESKEEFEQLIEDLDEEWRVRGPLETFYLTQIARDIWRLNRFNWGEDAYFADLVYDEVDARVKNSGKAGDEEARAKLMDVDAAISRFISEEPEKFRHMESTRRSILRSLRENIATLKGLQRSRSTIEGIPAASNNQ